LTRVNTRTLEDVASRLDPSHSQEARLSGRRRSIFVDALLNATAAWVEASRLQPPRRGQRTAPTGRASGPVAWAGFCGRGLL